MKLHDQEDQLLLKHRVRLKKRRTLTPKGGTKVTAEAGVHSLSARNSCKEVSGTGAHACEDVLDAACAWQVSGRWKEGRWKGGFGPFASSLSWC